jgi:hypothetical protein
MKEDETVVLGAFVGDEALNFTTAVFLEMV